MKKVACLAVLAAILPVSAWADCAYPKKPGNPPNGNRAPRAEMLAAKKVNDQYQADINAYLQCLKAEHQDLLGKNASASEADKKKMVTKWEKQNDAAVDEAQQVADRINEQIRLCKARADNCSK
jgi:hypothetical protein